MGTSLDEVLSGQQTEQAATEQPAQQAQEAAAPATTEQSATGEGQTQEGAAEGAATAEDGQGATPAQTASTMVPLKALEEERKGRQDWKEKAIRFEEELKHLRTQQSQPQSQQQPQAPADLPLPMLLLNERMNNSEMMLRQSGLEDIDQTLEVFQKAAQQNPALGAELVKQVHPWKWAYDQGKRMKAMEEIGEDPAAYRERVKAELKAEMEAAAAQSQEQPAAAPTPKPVIPQSLASARSAAPRTATTFTGPTALSDILKR